MKSAIFSTCADMMSLYVSRDETGSSRNAFDVSGVYPNLVCRQRDHSADEALSHGGSPICWRLVARAPWREHCGTPSRQVRKYDSERRDLVPGFWRNRALRGSQVKNGREFHT